MSNQLPYRLEVDNRRATVTLLPELNEVPWADIERVGSEILSRIEPLSSPQLLVDLCNLNYMGSAQVALVVRMFKLVKEKNGKMVVANRDPMVMEVLSLAGLNKVWTIVDSRERAGSMLGGGSLMSSSGGGGGGEDDANPLPGTIALIAAVAAAIFAVLHLANPALIPSRGDLFGLLGASGVAFAAGLWAMNGGNRNLGIGVILVSVLLLLYGVFEIAKPASGSPAPTAPESTPEEKKTETPADPGAPAGATAAPPAGAPAGAVPPATPDAKAAAAAVPAAAPPAAAPKAEAAPK